MGLETGICLNPLDFRRASLCAQKLGMHLNALPNEEGIKQMLNCLAELGSKAASPLPEVNNSYHL